MLTGRAAARMSTEPSHRHALCSVCGESAEIRACCPDQGQGRTAHEPEQSMKHSSTRDLFEYWNERRGSRPAPERGDIEPGPIRHVLGDSFIASFNPAVGHPFRLAGTRLCGAFGRELKGEPFVDLWAEPTRHKLRELTNSIGTESAGVVAGANGRSVDGSTVELELLILPLSHCGRMPARFLGALTPLAVPYWLGIHPIVDLSLGSLRHLGPWLETVPPRFRVTSGRRRHGLVVYDGGRPAES